ncbi:hypothetical protein [Actinoplanes sp. NPDC023714]|uniref:hypothetical protein n=1 Tax=Actinoplanes sp. NPDC023714 TaxID=3154322 RepID=UPI00340F02B9
MERGPLTLFGAIVAVGLGPALWLGAQLGTVTVAPNERPSTVGEQYPETDMDFGGVGAGETPDQADWIRVFPDPTAAETSEPPSVKPSTARTSKAVVKPRPSSPSPSTPPSPSAGPSASDPAVSPSPVPDEDPSGEPSEEPSGEPSDEAPEPSGSPSGDDEGGGGGPPASFAAPYTRK